MLFRSRKPRTMFAQISAFLWPRGGVGRSVDYVRHRIGRLPDSPHRLAAGFAAGVACSFTPLVGLHFILSGILSFLLRGNLVASALGTFVGNPWTFPLIWWASFELGTLLMGQPGSMNPFETVNIRMLLSDPWAVFGPIFTPMLVGAVPLALISWCLSYFLLRRFLLFYRAKRIARIAKRHGKAHSPA